MKNWMTLSMLATAFVSTATAHAAGGFTCSDGTFHYRSFTVLRDQQGVHAQMKQLTPSIPLVNPTAFGLPAKAIVTSVRVTFPKEACRVAQSDARTLSCAVGFDANSSLSAKLLVRGLQPGAREQVVDVKITGAEFQTSVVKSLDRWSQSGETLLSRAAELEINMDSRSAKIHISSDMSDNPDQNACIPVSEIKE